MRVSVIIFSLIIFHFSFTQDHEKKVNELLFENRLKEAIEYIEENNLQEKDGFRYNYWDFKRRLDYSDHPDEMKKQALSGAAENSESSMIEYMFIYHHFNNKEDESIDGMQNAGMELEQHIDALNSKDPFYARLNILFAEYLVDMGYFEEAIKRTKLALKVDPKIRNGNLLKGYALTLKDRGKKESV